MSVIKTGMLLPKKSLSINLIDLQDFEYCINMQYLLLSHVFSYLSQFFFPLVNYMLISKPV